MTNFLAGATRWSVAVLATSAISSVLAGGHASATNTAQPTTLGSVTTPAAVASGTLLGHGKEAARTAAPWKQVGPGWSIDTWRAHPLASTAQPSTVYLVNPIGGRYKLLTLPAGQVPELVTPDGRRLLTDQVARSGLRTYTEWSLAAGKSVHRFRLTADPTRYGTNLVSYTKPKGLSLLASIVDYRTQTATLKRYDLSGRLQRTYPQQLPGVGALVADSAVSIDNGTQIVMGAAHGVAVLRSDGEVIHTTRARTGYTSCGTGPWWSPTVLELKCFRGQGSDVFMMNPADGVLHPLTRFTSAGNGLGFTAAYRYSRGVLLVDGSGCGPGAFSQLVRGNGVPRTIKPPASTSGISAMIGTVGDVGYFQSVACDQNADSFFSHNLVTGASSVLLGPGVNGGGVDASFLLGS